MEVAAAAGFVADDIKASGADSALTEAAQDDDSVLQREVYAYLPRARTRQAVRLLLAQPAEWRKLCERPAEADIAAVLRNYGLWWHLRQPRVAIVGPPNAGKSTLANALFGRERSITADLPGTTRDWVGEVADLDGLAVMLIDTPGQRTCHNPTDDAIEQAAIELSRREIARSDLTILVLDGSRELMPQQRPLFADYPGAICVRNKADLPCAWSVADVTSLAGLPTAATTKQGLSELVGRIRRFFDCDQAVIGPCWWTPRQREILQRALVDRGALSEI
jgi:tRNA modification GTPase